MAPLRCMAGTTLMEVGGQLVQALHVGFAAGDACVLPAPDHLEEAACREACLLPAQNWNTGGLPSLPLSLAACHHLGDSALMRGSLDLAPRKGKWPPEAAL